MLIPERNLWASTTSCGDSFTFFLPFSILQVTSQGYDYHTSVTQNTFCSFINITPNNDKAIQGRSWRAYLTTFLKLGNLCKVIIIFSHFIVYDRWTYANDKTSYLRARLGIAYFRCRATDETLDRNTRGTFWPPKGLARPQVCGACLNRSGHFLRSMGTCNWNNKWGALRTPIRNRFSSVYCIYHVISSNIHHILLLRIVVLLFRNVEYSEIHPLHFRISVP
jgi:hypothetical protein